MKKTLVEKGWIETLYNFSKFGTKVDFKQLSNGEYMILNYITNLKAEDPEGNGIYVSHLAETMQVSTPAVSRFLKTLEAKGLISREAETKDRRNTLVNLTDKGTLLHGEAHQELCDFLDSVADRMGEEYMDQLLVLLNQLNIAADEILSMENQSAEEQILED